jgi:predicted CXXCH cytochrome family protein
MKDRLNNVCFACHSKIEAATLLPVQHKPVAEGNCLLCHQPHVSPYQRLLRKSPLQECLPCHATQMRFSHPVGMVAGKPVIDPTSGKMLVCSRCHAIHGSETANLLPMEENDLCRSCHQPH